MELHDVPTFRWESDTLGTLSFYSAHTCLKLKGPALEMRLLWSRTGICGWNVSVKESLMLGDPFSVLFLCNLKYISLYFIQNSMHVTSKWLISLAQKDPRYFGSFTKFQHNTQIFMWTACVLSIFICPHLS